MPGGRSVWSLGLPPVLGTAVVPDFTVLLALSLIFGGLLAVRLAQGSPPSELAGQSTRSAVASAALEAPAVGEGDRLITAQAGDSLWSIAGDHRNDVPIARYVDALIDLNDDASIQTGQRIALP